MALLMAYMHHLALRELSVPRPFGSGSGSSRVKSKKNVFFMLLSQGSFLNTGGKQCQAEKHEVNKIITTFVFIQLESLNIHPPAAYSAHKYITGTD